jgi:hypothetical protein
MSQQQTFEQTERLAARVEAAARDPRILHVVARSEWPIALCGALVSEDFNPHRTDTAGRDRCTECLMVLGKRRSARG